LNQLTSMGPESVFSYERQRKFAGGF